MQRLARVAIGTVQPGVDSSFVGWALMSACQHADLRVQHFAARACFAPRDVGAGVTGQSTRHLDTWLMEPDGCRSLFLWGASGSDLVVVEGRFRSALPESEMVGGDLETLCEWLDLPALAIVDATRIGDCDLPVRPARLDGVIVMGASDCSSRCRLQTMLEAFWGVPVLGFAADAPALRAEIAALELGASPPKVLCDSLAQSVLEPATVERVLALAIGRELAFRAPVFGHAVPYDRPLRVAMAYDDAFHCYFPDALDQLELLGAELEDFSPLRDDRLPENIDLVYFGCGRPELYARQLVENCCMVAALRRHVARGGRLYAECGGLAYLGRHIELPEGCRVPMADIIPAAASIVPNMAPPTAVEFELAANSWLGTPGHMVRGYRTGRWRFEPLEDTVVDLLATDAGEHDMLAYHRVIGSRVHLNFAALPVLMQRLFEPHLLESRT